MLLIGLWLLSGYNAYWRSIVNLVIPEKYLPDKKHAIPTAAYEQLESTNFSAEEEDEGILLAVFLL
jgi:hypothetical protein